MYCIVGDGEMAEGSCLEALLFQEAHLPNLNIIIDANELQAMGKCGKLSNLTHDSLHCDGHNMTELKQVISRSQLVTAHTIKGKGLPCAEGVPAFHYRVPTAEEYQEYLDVA